MLSFLIVLNIKHNFVIMFYNVSTETTQTNLNHFLDKVFKIVNKAICFENFVYDVADLVYLHLKM